MDKPTVAVIGATGAVGQELLSLIALRAFPAKNIRAVASARSAGRTLRVGKNTWRVEALENFDFSDVDIAFFSAGGSISSEWVPRAAAAGALAVDNSNAFRMAPDVPLIVPQVNPEMAPSSWNGRIIANPNCSTIQLVRVLHPIQRLYGIKRIVVATYQAASGGGLRGIDELESDTRRVLAAEPTLPPRRFPAPLAFNAVPMVGDWLDDGCSLEERKLVRETRKIMGVPDLRLTATTVRVPVRNGHSEAVHVECERPVDVAEVTAALRAAPDMAVYGRDDDPPYPTPRMLGDRTKVHVGRIRRNPDAPSELWLWVVADNLWIGAALNAVQIAELVLARSSAEAVHA
jgi:aspartate-semialdehyde dehydrogenase